MNARLMNEMRQMSQFHQRPSARAQGNGGRPSHQHDGDDDGRTVLHLEPEPSFVETPQVRDLSERALRYLQAGFALHLRGAAGTGKTTLAMHVANQLGRPVMLLHGDDQWTTSDLVGGEYGYHARRVVDNFIHSVLKTEEDIMRRWVDNRLTIACEHGFTLIYDEFNRSRPEANNVLLSILEERMLSLPPMRGELRDYVPVHPEFRALFTSNPEEYAGVHLMQDALLDRMITLDLDYPDCATEVAITQAKSGLARERAERVVALVRAWRARALDSTASSPSRTKPTIRASLMIAQVLAKSHALPQVGDPLFEAVCRDVLVSKTAQRTNEREGAPQDSSDAGRASFDALLKKCCPPLRGGKRAARAAPQDPADEPARVASAVEEVAAR